VITPEPLVKLEHVRALHYCSRGLRIWFERNGLDWPEFCRNGLPASQIEAVDDAMAQAAAKLAREEAAS
jgi:hypothetical protein